MTALPLDEEGLLRRGIAEVGSLMYQKGFIAATDGNISARLGDDHLVITPSGVCKGFITPDQMSVIALEDLADAASPTAGGYISTEIRMHLAVYRERPDVRAVCHGHPPHAVAFTLAGLDLNKAVIPEIVVTLGTIPTAPYGTPGTDELPDSIRETIRCSDAMLLERHGALCVGENLTEAFQRMEQVEHTAKIVYLAKTLGSLKTLDPDQVARLLQTRADLGIDSMNTICSLCGGPMHKGHSHEPAV